MKELVLLEFGILMGLFPYIRPDQNVVIVIFIYQRECFGRNYSIDPANFITDFPTRLE